MSVISGIVGANAASDASDAQKYAAMQANATTMQMYEEGRADTAPWREAGKNALAQLVNKVNAGPGDYTKSPGYQFRLDEGNKAINNSAAARGNLLSGATNKALTKYGQDYATGDYQNFLANYYNSLTPLQSLAQVGQTTSSQNATQGNNVAQTLSANTIAAGNAQAAGSINQANAITGAMNSGANNALMWQYLNKGGVNNTGTGVGTTAALADVMPGAYEGYNFSLADL